jgi:uncharacterized protein (DUF1697 family)
MDELRLLFESLGCTDVTTYVQSGNVVFSRPELPSTADLAEAIRRTFGISSSIVLRDRRSLEQIVAGNPFPGADPVTVHIGFMDRDTGPDAGRDLGLDPDLRAPERFVLRESEVYLHLPQGMGRAKLPALLDRRLPAPVTYRNWSTVTKLLELTGGCADPLHPGS